MPNVILVSLDTTRADRGNQALKDLTADGKGAEAPSRVLD
jgi:hypothetical protein